VAERRCSNCLSDLGELSGPCPNCGEVGLLKTTRFGEIISFSPEAGVPCQGCGTLRREVRFTHFRRVLGLVFFDRIYVYSGYFCASCRRRLFLKAQALTLLLGWWGLLAMFVRNPYAIFSNFVALARPPILPGATNVINLRDLVEGDSTEAEDAAIVRPELPGLSA